MISLKSPHFRALALYLLIVAGVTSPIWCIQDFAVQDGSAHVYNAFLMSELTLKRALANSQVSLNAFTVPNSSGHWVLVLLLQLFSAINAVKVMLILTYALFVAAIVWLRFRTAGSDGSATTLLLGAALGINFFWFGGFFNFTLGVVGFIFLLAIFARWQENLTSRRTVLISLVFLAIYFSHIATFGITVVGLLILALWSDVMHKLRTVTYLLIAAIPSVMCAVVYRSTTQSAEALQPSWRWLDESSSPFSFARNLLVDPFIIISRKTVPFSLVNSDLVAVFSPGLWIFTCVALLLIFCSSLFSKQKGELRKVGPYLTLFALLVLGGWLAPTDFGLSNGSILRERLLLCGLCLIVPVFNIQRRKLLQKVIPAILTCVLIVQTAALWEYGVMTNKTVREFAKAQSVISNDDQIMTVVNIRDGFRFHSLVDPHLGLLTSVGKQTFVWDNYEIGHYLFPVTAKSVDDRQFIQDLAISHVFVLNGPRPEFEETARRLEKTMEFGNGRFTKVMISGRNGRVEEILYRWFDPVPIYESENVLVLKHR